MKAINKDLQLVDAATPSLRDGEVLVKVAAAGVNRADLMQAAGKYPPPEGEPEIMGLECAGVIADPGTTDRKEGEQVGCLLAGGGYAEYVAVPEGQLTPIPQGLTLEETAGVVEVACTVWSTSAWSQASRRVTGCSSTAARAALAPLPSSCARLWGARWR